MVAIVELLELFIIVVPCWESKGDFRNLVECILGTPIFSTFEEFIIFLFFEFFKKQYELS